MSDATDQCKFCNRLGLSILPMRIAYIPNGDTTLTSVMNNDVRGVSTVKKGGYQLRVISEGYVYLYDPRAGGFWRCYAATQSGEFKEILLEDGPPEKQPKFTCSRHGHNIVSSVVSIKNAIEATEEIWVGYSRVWLTKAVRNKLKKDAGLRVRLMVNLNPASVVKGGKVPEASGVRLSSGMELGIIAPEYADDDSPHKVDISRWATATTSAAVSKKGQADPLIKRMREFSPNNAILLALPDAAGVMQDINGWRNLEAGHLDQFVKKEQSKRERIIGDIVLGMEETMANNNQQKEWDDRFKPKVDYARVKREKKAYDKKVEKFEKEIIARSDDWYAWASSGAFRSVWHLYDINDPKIGAALENHFTHSVFGSGGTRKEQEWWQYVMTKAPLDIEHPLWYALAAGDKSVVDFAKSKVGKGVGITKRVHSLPGEIKKWWNKREEEGLRRAAQVTSGMLGFTVSSQLQKIAQTDPQAALVAGRRLQITLTSRVEELILPYRQEASLKVLVQQMHEVTLGPAKASLSVKAQEVRQMRLFQRVNGSFFGGHFSSKQKVVIEAWMPESAYKQATNPVFSASNIKALPKPKENLWYGVKHYLTNNKFSNALTGISAALSISSLTMNLIEIERTIRTNGGSLDKVTMETMLGLTSGTLGLIGLSASVYGDVVSKTTSATVNTIDNTTVVIRAAKLKFLGGTLGTVAATVESVKLAQQSYKAYVTGDDDAGSSYRWASIATFVSGVAALAITTVPLAAGLVKVGVTTGVIVSVGSFLSFIPVWGWIVIAIGAIALGLFFLFKAATEEDTPLEIWLSRCVLGNPKYKGKEGREAYPNIQEEMEELQQAIYGLKAELEWKDRIGYDEVSVNMIMPGYSKDSEFAFYLEVNGLQFKKIAIDRKTSAFSHDPDLKPQPPVQHELRKASASSIDGDDVLQLKEGFRISSIQHGVATFSGKVRVNEKYLQGAKLKFEYWPDIVNKPELKMMPSSTNLMLAVD